MRDLREDLGFCEKVWLELGAGGYSTKEFINRAIKRWPEAIHRAIAAEARVRELEEAANKVLGSRVSMDGEKMAVSVDSLEELRMAYRIGRG